MIARLQKLTTSALLALAAIWLASLWHIGEPTWATAGAIFIVMGYAVVLAIEFVLLSVVHGDDPAPRASFGTLLRAWLGEVVAAPRVFCWRQPFRSKAEPDFLSHRGRGRRGIVFVHGLLCNRGFWNPWMARMRKRRISFIAVNLEPVFASVNDYLATVDEAVIRMRSVTGLAPVLVAHSMGGLVVRAWLVAFGSNSRVHRVVTIATPHRGTWLARFGQSPSSREMCVDSVWLRRLEQFETAQPAHDRFTCFYGNCDNIVFPPSNAKLPGADNRPAHGSAHVQMAFREDVYQAVLEWLEPHGEVAASAR